MARRKKEPLRILTVEEQAFLETLSRARSAPADQIARATGILAVAQGKSYKDTAQLCRQAQGATIASWVARFNAEGIAAVVPRHGGGHIPRFTGEVKEAILATFHGAPNPEVEGTTVWSITTLQKALVRQGIVLSGYSLSGYSLSGYSLSGYSLWGLLRDEGYTFQKDRSWCHTGESKRKRIRKSGTVVETVVDPDTEAKKS